MSEFSVSSVIEEAVKIIDSLTPDDFDKLFENDSVESKYSNIKKWEELRTRAEGSSSSNKEDILTLINIIQFVRLSILDLSIVFNQSFKNNGSEIEKKLLYRICAMMIYEITQDIPEMLGKNLRISVKNLTRDNKEIMGDISEISKGIGTLQKEDMVAFLKDVRVISMAHKDHDSKKLLQTVESITENEIMILTAYILSWNRQFERFLEKLSSKFIKTEY